MTDRSRETARSPSKRPSLFGYEEFLGQSHIGGLDGLRALAILLVLIHHVLVDLGGHAPLYENGRYGVHLFFIISGFLICTLFLRERREFGRINLPRFYGRRILRLMPLYYAVLVAYVVIVLVLKQFSPENQQDFVERLPAYALYFSNWETPAQGPFFCAWSLAAEEQFYLLFGLAIVLMPTRRIVLAILAAIAVKVFVFGMHGQVDAQSKAYRILFSYQEAILAGVLLAYALNVPGIYRFATRVLGGRSTPWVLLAMIAAWLAWHPIKAQSSWDAEIMYFAMTLLVGSVAIRRNLPLLEWRPLAHIGVVSYGIYLLHMLVFSTVKKLPGGEIPAVALLLTTVGSIAFACASYQWFEKPIIHWYKKRLAPTGPRRNPHYVPTLNRSLQR